MDKFDVGFTIYMMVVGGVLGLLLGVLLGVNAERRKIAHRCVETLTELDGISAETLLVAVKAFCGG